jgi:hypothetical protein
MLSILRELLSAFLTGLAGFLTGLEPMGTPSGLSGDTGFASHLRALGWAAMLKSHVRDLHYSLVRNILSIT